MLIKIVLAPDESFYIPHARQEAKVVGREVCELRL